MQHIRSSREFGFDESTEIIRDSGLIQALDNFVEEAGNNEALGDFCRDATRMEVKHFVFVDLAGSGAMGAADVVGQNFQAGH